MPLYWRMVRGGGHSCRTPGSSCIIVGRKRRIGDFGGRSIGLKLLWIGNWNFDVSVFPRRCSLSLDWSKSRDEIEGKAPSVIALSNV